MQQILCDVVHFLTRSHSSVIADHYLNNHVKLVLHVMQKEVVEHGGQHEESEDEPLRDFFSGHLEPSLFNPSTDLALSVPLPVFRCLTDVKAQASARRQVDGRDPPGSENSNRPRTHCPAHLLPLPGVTLGGALRQDVSIAGLRDVVNPDVQLMLAPAHTDDVAAQLAELLDRRVYVEGLAVS